MNRPSRANDQAKRRRRILLVLLLLLLVFYSLALSQGWLDRVAPQLEAQVPNRVPADEAFEVRVSSSEPVVYTYSYGGKTAEAVTQNLRLKLNAGAGKNVLSVTATDGADNKTTERYTIVGIPKPDVKAQTTQTAVSGDPVGVRLEYGPNLKIKQVATTLNGQPVPTFWNQTGAAAFGGVPLGSETSTLPLDISLTDEFNRVTTLSRTVAVTADPRGTELLNLSPEVLSSSTPENRALEETTLDAAYAKDAPYPEWRRPFMLPVDGITTSSFGASRQYGPGGNISFHQGADLAAPEGTPVHATNAGTVRVAGFYPIKGGLVMIDHGGGICSLYFHQSKILVRAGETVRRGQIIGEVGTTGLSTGPHLHWEMRVDELATNPLEWVGKVVP